MIIPSIGKQKIAYKDHEEVSFESLDFYLNLAKKIIAKMGSTFFAGLSKQMLKDEDAISFVANAIMMGDWRWKNSNEDKDKPTKSLYSYRNQCGIWAIKTYVTKQYKNKHTKKKINTAYSLNYQENDTNLENIVEDVSQKDPLSILIAEEDSELRKEAISKLLDSELVSSKQKEYIRLYYFENMTLEKIGLKFNITREAVRQSIKSAISKIKALIV